MDCPSCHEDKPGWPDLWCNDPANLRSVNYICFDCAHAHLEAIMAVNESAQNHVASLSYQFGRMTMSLMHAQTDLASAVTASPDGRPAIEVVDRIRTQLTDMKADLDHSIGLSNSLLALMGRKET
jgi:hypothetical protein